MRGALIHAILATVLAGATLSAEAAPVRADGRVDARYKLSIAGLELGRATFLIEVKQKSYVASGSARITGVLQAISTGKGTAGARGTLARDGLSPEAFTMQAVSDKKDESIRLSIAGNAVKSAEVTPPVKDSDDRVPVSDGDRKGVLDPMTAALMLVPGKGNLVTPESCNRTVPIFDGRQRYDLALTYARTEDVKAEEGGYSGPSLVCRVAYRPISGHRPDRAAVKYMMKNKDILVWLVPIPGTRLLAPFRASVATAIGTAQLEAVSFTTSGTPGD
ncbi:DUF3108 domain-containing protein [Ancylobacter sp. 6x-1]|uniref:DUF3108 domain-containing protein n=1 Tax=Ancylobacter crimeensis TaxID=2579147 RepID=A0ABT0DDP2_9HYPH|nr:DUF3108 domain-containing protein [Ancylobacter crimeensis]MCK0198085.1 DUF3108 domain-containing protein [Ancylobacter crimeensis]